MRRSDLAVAGSLVGTIVVALIVALGVAAGGLAGCAPRWKQTPYDRLFQHEPAVVLERAPRRRSPSDWWDRGFQLVVRPLARAISPGHWLADAGGGRPARDVNDLGQVADSEWYENRISRYPLTVDHAFRGATRSEGPASGPLFVTSGKLEGASPGFVVRDGAGITWFLKLDPPASPQLSTSAEVIASRLLWLAGYHVPEIHVFDLEAKRFRLDPRAKTRDRLGRSIPLSQRALDRLIGPLNTDAAGRVRVLVSRKPDGIVIGPFDYRGVNHEDANDHIEHEHRRSLRALWVFSAWLNNTDTRNANSLDVFRPVTPAGGGVIRHYLLDFGNALGATGIAEKIASDGSEYLLDWNALFSNLALLGSRYPRWERLRRSPSRSVGLFEAAVFAPERWRPRYPNPAFQECTRSDTLWAASVLARIQPAHIRAAVAAGRYHEEGSATSVIETLLERRRKLLAYALAGAVEVDQPRIRGSILVLDDLRALGGLSSGGPLQYEVRWNRTRRTDRVLARGVITSTAPATPTTLDLGERDPVRARVLGELQIDLAGALAAAHREEGLAADPFITVALSRRGTRAAIHLRVVRGQLLPVAIVR
ncbi:MAG: hypothetical protein H0X17_05250 [Deltaproteobacteria bacterium]|nr:hypothetical protein [Deltaproteobacteria bacterium]